jgi:hypothetical protein
MNKELYNHCFILQIYIAHLYITPEVKKCISLFFFLVVLSLNSGPMGALPLEHSPALFCFSYFSDRVSVFASAWHKTTSPNSASCCT